MKPSSFEVHRRQFLATVVIAFGSGHRIAAAADRHARIMTVTGAIDAKDLGMTLPHEHVLVDFIGAEKVSPQRYDRDEAFAVARPHLDRVKELGCQTVFECTPAYVGRDPILLRKLSESCGMRLVTNTGYYGASQGKFLPKHVLDETADQLSDRWLMEWRHGIDGTDVRPGFIKTGVDGGPLSDINRKIVAAAARTHRQSGLTIAGHTGDGQAALEQLDILKSEQVAPRAWIWVHAQSERNRDIHLQVAKRGAWVEFDGVSPASVEEHVSLVLNMKQHRMLHRVLISHDAGWYWVGEPHGGKFRDYETVFTQFIPALRQGGLSNDEIRLITVDNPASAFSIQIG